MYSLAAVTAESDPAHEAMPRTRQPLIDEDPPCAQSGSTTDRTDWSEQHVDSLVGTELEWSTVQPDTRARNVKNKCLFCNKDYPGGPSHIRNHLDSSETRNVSDCAA